MASVIPDHIKMITSASQQLKSALDEARQTCEEKGAKEFVDNFSGILGKGITIYAQLFKSGGFLDRSELDKKIAITKSLQDAASDLLDTEQDWMKFLGEVDHKLDSTIVKAENPIKAGDNLDLNISLTRVGENQAQLRLGEVVSQINGQYLLLVLNRHFA